MTFYYDNLKEIAIAVGNYIDKLGSQDKMKFCNLGKQLINNKEAKPYLIAAAICKHYIIDKSEKIYIVKPEIKKMLDNEDWKVKAKHIDELYKFSDFKHLGRIIRRLLRYG